MKKTYESAEIEIELFTVSNQIITGSSLTDGDTDIDLGGDGTNEDIDF